jgi:hypothetical protein
MPGLLSDNYFSDYYSNFQNAVNNISPEQKLQDEYNQQMTIYNKGIQFLTGKPGGDKLIAQLNEQHQQWLTDYQNRSGQQQETTLADTTAKQQATANTGYDQILAQAQKAYNPESIANYYNVAQGNLNRQAGNAGAMATRTAGAHSTNMLNPSGFIMSQLSQSQAPYAAQTGNLQATAAGAQQSGAEGLTNLMYLLQRAKQGDTDAANQLQYQYASLQQNQNQYQQGLANSQYQFNQNQANQQAGTGDWITSLAGLAASAYGGGLFSGKTTGTTGTDYSKYGFQWGQ